MKNQKGFLFFNAVFCMFMAALIMLAIISWPKIDADGTVCRVGYKFIYGSHAYTQILDSQGHGIPCGKK